MVPMLNLQTNQQTLKFKIMATQKKTKGEKESMSPKELIVIANYDAGIRASAMGINSVTGLETSDMNKFMSDLKAEMTPLFGVSEDKIKNEISSLKGVRENVPDLDLFYKIKVQEDKMEKMAEDLTNMNGIVAAYVKPPTVYAQEPIALEEEINVMESSSQAVPAGTPDFTSRQGYLGPATAGVDAYYAWSKPGGKGNGIGIIDIEGAWRFSHEDLLQNQGGVIGGVESSNLGWRNHGTAVVGVIGGDASNGGIQGICPEAHVRAVSIFGTTGTAGAIRIAADASQPGDIILLEIHRAGPRYNFQGRADQKGYIAIEFWPDDFAAIQYAVSKGVIVVEAAGNGAENLDDSIYNQKPNGFPSNWSNPFNVNNPQSNAVIVGAGAPPPGTHGRDHGPDRSRLAFSNYGARLDCQGWGREVTTTGYGDLQGGTFEDEWYTDKFSGTSSASPCVVGALGCIQGILKADGQPILNAIQARNILRNTGSPQQDAVGRPKTQRIGNRPNLRQIIDRYFRIKTVSLYRYWNTRIGDHFYTTNKNELGQGRYGWVLEEIQCKVFKTKQPKTTPLYRYWNPRIGDHFYTTNWRELGRGRYNYRFEGIQCYVHAKRLAGTIPLYRYWNPRIGDHFYTTNWRELGRGRRGYRFEGIQCYVFSKDRYPQQQEVPEQETNRTASFENGSQEMFETYADNFLSNEGLGSNEGFENLQDFGIMENFDSGKVEQENYIASSFEIENQDDENQEFSISDSFSMATKFANDSFDIPGTSKKISIIIE